MYIILCSFILFDALSNCLDELLHSKYKLSSSMIICAYIHVRSLALVGPCLGLFSFVLTFWPSIFLTTLLLFFLFLFLPLASPLLFPCAAYTVWDTHHVHGSNVPYSSCCIVPCILVF